MWVVFEIRISVYFWATIPQFMDPVLWKIKFDQYLEKIDPYEVRQTNINFLMTNDNFSFIISINLYKFVFSIKTNISMTEL